MCAEFVSGFIMASTVTHTPWDNEKTIDFINSIHCHPEIWNFDHPKYRDRNIKRDIWNKISNKFGISVEVAQRKFKSLRTYAKCEVRKLQARKKSGTETTQLESSWFAYSAMSFILNIGIPDKGAETAGTADRQVSFLSI